MWLLSCDGDHFGGKRFWLRPGTTHLLGRTTGQAEAGQRIRHIDHKTVSRKHLTLEVFASEAENVSKLFAKSQIKLHDGSKAGTSVNGDRIQQSEKTLIGGETEVEYIIKLGQYGVLFHLLWRPVVLSLTHLGKKSKETGLAVHRETFKNTDVKVVGEYVANVTTHCVAKKRNMPGPLQALLQAKWVVTDSYIGAVARALRSGGPGLESVLEDDFDANWPDETEHPVPAGQEPNPRPDHFMKPKPERAELFHNFNFVFLSQGQHDSLFPVITTGGGKALIYNVEVGVSKAEDVINYINGAAGNKKRSGQTRPSDNGEKGGVVVVRLNESREEGMELMQTIDLALNQRSIEQNGFLEPILTLDTSDLIRELPDESQISAADNSRSQSQVDRSQQIGTYGKHSRPTNDASREPSQPAATRTRNQELRQPAERAPENTMASDPPTTQHQAPDSSLAPASPTENAAARRRARRLVTQSRFKGFDDFDPSQYTKPASRSPEPSYDEQDPSQGPSVQDMDVDEPSQAQQTQQASRKRPAQASLQEEEDRMVDDLLTGQSKMKRRKLASGVKDDDSVTLAAKDRQEADKKARAKKKEKDMDVMAEITARRKREDEEYRKQEELTREALDGMDVKEMKNLVKVVEMDVPVRERPARRGAAEGGDGHSDRWDPAWNGRKNFKKFRPQGQRNGDAPRLPRVIVALEEVSKKAHGIGEEYWATNSSKSKSKSKSQSQSQSQRRSVATAESDEDADGRAESSRFRRRLQNSHQEDEMNPDDILPDEIAGHARDEALEAAANANANSVMNSTPSQTFATDSQRRAAGKRPAADQGMGPPAKKAKQSQRAPSTRQTVTIDDDDDDDDALKFRRRRK